MTRTITRLILPTSNPLLGRHIHHDSESKRYPFPTAGLSIATVRHERRIPIFDQGQLGSCTGNAGLGVLGTDPFYTTLTATPRYPFTEDGAVALYSYATTIDDIPGQYPPDDTGSSGLAVAQALKAAGEVAGYTHTFTLENALKALTQVPLAVGIPWYTDMFNPNSEGIIHPTGTVAGGHEIAVDEYDSARDLVGMTNSWGDSWGLAGRCYMPSAEFGQLLAQHGDVIAFVPRTAPAPTPTPVPPVPPADADTVFARFLHPWVRANVIDEILDVKHIAAQARTWLAARGL